MHDFHFSVELQEWSYLVPYLTVVASGRFNTGNIQDILIRAGFFFPLVIVPRFEFFLMATSMIFQISRHFWGKIEKMA